MPRRAPLLSLLASAAALTAPAAASAATDCPLLSSPTGTEHAIPGTGLQARDPYDGVLSRNRLFFDFSVRGGAAALGGVAKVQWALDGAIVREDPQAPFEWKRLSASSKMPAGDHTITVTVVPSAAGAAPASTSFPLKATDCQRVGFNAEIPKRAAASLMTWSAGAEGPGEPLTGVRATATRNVLTALPARLRNRQIGTISVAGPTHRSQHTYALRSGNGTTVLHRGTLRVRYRPGSATFVEVLGLPDGIQTVTVRLKPGLVRVRNAKGPYNLGGTLTAASGSARAQIGGIYV